MFVDKCCFYDSYTWRPSFGVKRSWGLGMKSSWEQLLLHHIITAQADIINQYPWKIKIQNNAIVGVFDVEF